MDTSSKNPCRTNFAPNLCTYIYVYGYLGIAPTAGQDIMYCGSGFFLFSTWYKPYNVFDSVKEAASFFCFDPCLTLVSRFQDGCRENTSKQPGGL